VNRVTRPADFRAVIRRGRRVAATNAILHVLHREQQGPSRLGFVVAKSVGNAVTRNLVKRRLRAAGIDVIAMMGDGVDVVIRALPASAEASWATLHAEITEGIKMEMARA